jgi:hypothetical protein
MSRQHDAAAAGLVERREDLALGREVFGGRLDDEVDRLQLAAVEVGRLDPAQDLFAIRRRQLLLVDQLRQLLADGGPPALGDVALGVRQRDREAVGGRELRDAAPHLAGADDADTGNAIQRTPDRRGHDCGTL